MWTSRTILLAATAASLFVRSRAGGYGQHNWESHLQSASPSEAHLYDLHHLQNLDLPEYSGPQDDIAGLSRPESSSSSSWTDPDGYQQLGNSNLVYGQDPAQQSATHYFPQNTMFTGNGDFFSPSTQSMSWPQQHQYVDESTHEPHAFEAYLHGMNNLNLGSSHLHSTTYALGEEGDELVAAGMHSEPTAAKKSRASRKARAPRPVFTGINPRADPDDDFFQDEDPMRKQIGLLWKRKGLWVGLQPRELAAGIAEIKVELGTAHSKSIGLYASNHVKKYASGVEGYIESMKDITKKYTKKILQLESNLHRYHPEMEPEQARLLVMAGLRFLQDRATYLGKCKKPYNEGSVVDRIEKRLDEEATFVWSVLETSDTLAYELQAQQQSGLQPFVSIETIERASRQLHHLIPSRSREDIADLLRRYMIKFLHKTSLEVDQFTKARNDWLKTVPYSLADASGSGE